MKNKEEILKEAEVEWGIKVGPKSNQREQTWVLLSILSKALTQTREETLKEIIREYQDNELDGKGYDFYFSIRAKIDELNKLKK